MDRLKGHATGSRRFLDTPPVASAACSSTSEPDRPGASLTAPLRASCAARPCRVDIAHCTPVPPGHACPADHAPPRRRPDLLEDLNDQAPIFISSLLFIFALAPLGAQTDPGKEELKLKLPKPMFIGTPDQHQERQPRDRSRASRARRSTCRRAPSCSRLKKKVTSSDMQPVIGELDMVTDGEKSGGDGYFIELGPGPAVGADRPRRVAPALRDPRVALSQPGARLPRRHRPGLRRSGVQDRRDDGLQQRPRQLVEARAPARTRSTSRSPRASCSTRRARRAATSGSTRTGTRRTT